MLLDAKTGTQNSESSRSVLIPDDDEVTKPSLH